MDDNLSQFKGLEVSLVAGDWIDDKPTLMGLLW